MVVAYYHCKYLFRIKIRVEATTLLSTENWRFELPVVTLWMDIVKYKKMVLVARGQVGCEVIISDHLVVLQPSVWLYLQSVDLAGKSVGVLLLVDQLPVLTLGLAD